MSIYVKGLLCSKQISLKHYYNLVAFNGRFAIKKVYLYGSNCVRQTELKEIKIAVFALTKIFLSQTIFRDFQNSFNLHFFFKLLIYINNGCFCINFMIFGNVNTVGLKLRNMSNLVCNSRNVALTILLVNNVPKMAPNCWNMPVGWPTVGCLARKESYKEN